MTALFLLLCSRLALRVATLVRHVGEELVHQALEHDRRLRELDLTAFLEEGFRAARADADVLAAQQASRLDAGVAVVRYLGVLVFDTQSNCRLVVLGIESDGLDAADGHTGHGHRRAGLEIADI